MQRQSPVVRPAAIIETAQLAGKATLETGARITKSGIKSGLRFMQFLRAYVRAFAAGFGSFLFLSELANGHFNILAILGTHLLSIIAAPFYALILAPTIFGFYRGLAIAGLSPARRTYALGSALGVLLLLSRIRSGQFLLAGDIKADLFAIATIVSGLIAAWTFTRAVDRMALTEAANATAA